MRKVEEKTISNNEKSTWEVTKKKESKMVRR